MSKNTLRWLLKGAAFGLPIGFGGAIAFYAYTYIVAQLAVNAACGG